MTSSGTRTSANGSAGTPGTGWPGEFNPADSLRQLQELYGSLVTGGRMSPVVG